MTSTQISTAFPYQSNYIDVLGAKIHYIEQGRGDPILFLHGMPASSYVWRNVIPHLSSLGQCIALDFIGMGKSDKPDIQYSVFDHIRYLEKFIDTLNLKRITFIMHGWGSIIGFDYAMKHLDKCKGLVFYESYIRPLEESGISLPQQEQLHYLDKKLKDDELSLNGNYFIDTLLSQEILRPLNPDELNYYREPFLKKGSEKPLKQYLKEIPRLNRNDKVAELIANYSKKLEKSDLPKLMLYSVPGFVTTFATAMWAKEHLKNFEIVEIGEELHYAQESDPTLMGETISIWLQGIEQQSIK